MPLYQRPSQQQQLAPASVVPPPAASFVFINGDNVKCTNDFVAYNDEPLIAKPVRTSVLVDFTKDDALLLAFSGDKIPGAIADVAWQQRQSQSFRRQYTVACPLTLRGTCTLTNSQVSLHLRQHSTM